jgi:hypothetical protein
MTSLRRRVALLLAPDLRALAALVDEALAALDQLDRHQPGVAVVVGHRADPAAVHARRKLAEARALLRRD